MKRGPTDCTHEHEYAASKNLYMYSLLSITSLQIILCKGNTIPAIKQIICYKRKQSVCPVWKKSVISLDFSEKV